MLGETRWIALGIVMLYLTFFAWGSVEAARVVGRPVWLFGHAGGTERLAAFGFRLAFALALLGLFLWPRHAVERSAIAGRRRSLSAPVSRRMVAWSAKQTWPPKICGATRDISTRGLHRPELARKKWRAPTEEPGGVLGEREQTNAGVSV